MKFGDRATGFIRERRSLGAEYQRILLVQQQADALVEELRRRRDHEQPRALDLSALREALEEVAR